MHDMDCERIALADNGPTALPTDAELRVAERRLYRAETRAYQTRIAYAALLGRSLAAFIGEHFPEVVSLDVYGGWEDRSFTLRDARGAEYEPSPDADDAYDDLFEDCWEFIGVFLPWGGECTLSLTELHRGALMGGEVV